MSEETQKPDFESIKQISPYGAEFWSARDLSKLLGYTTWRHFEGAINRAKTSCAQTGQKVSDHFVGGVKKVTLGSGAEREVEDYFLSRYACYMIGQNGDPRKPEIAAAQNYFAVSTRENELKHLYEAQEKRLRLRERVNDGNKDLAQAAYGAGVLSKNFGVFQNAGYRGLYGELDLEGIKARKGIEHSEDLLDRIGLAELGANALRIGLTEEKLRKEGIIGQAKAIETHHTVGKIIRQAIADTGATMPEDLPAEPSIKPLLDEKKRKRKKALQSNKTTASDGSEQGKLFE